LPVLGIVTCDRRLYWAPWCCIRQRNVRNPVRGKRNGRRNKRRRCDVLLYGFAAALAVSTVIAGIGIATSAAVGAIDVVGGRGLTGRLLRAPREFGPRHARLEATGRVVAGFDTKQFFIAQGSEALFVS
jgi:hypothetical protein